MGRVILVGFIILIIIVDIYLFKQVFLKRDVKEESIPNKNVVEITKEKETEESNIKETTNGIQTPKQKSPIAKKEGETDKPEVEKKKEIKKEKKILEERDKSIYGYMVANVYVNLRAEPNINSEIVTVIKKGSRVKIIGKKANHWKRVLYPSDGRVYEGWVDDRFFTSEGNLKSNYNSP